MLEGSLAQERLGGEYNPSPLVQPHQLWGLTLQAIEDPYRQAGYYLTIDFDSELSLGETLY